MKKVFLIAAMAMAVLSCSSNRKSVITVDAAGTADSTQVVVYKLAVSRLIPMDTLYVKGGKASCDVTVAPSAPDFFYLEMNGRRIASLILSSGEKVSVDAATASVSGSPESELLTDIEQEFASFQKNFDIKSADMAAAQKAGDEELRSALATEISRSFVEFKKSSVKHILSNPASMTDIPVLFRKVSSSLPVFGDVNDAIIMQKVYDTLSVLYPESPYVTSLLKEITARRNNIRLADHLSKAQEVSYPDIVLPDLSGEEHSLMSLQGNVVMVIFWSVAQENSSVMNAELKEIYGRYHSSGFEIYQVSLDTDKTAWATSIKGQSLPWASVIDTRGAASVYAALYNVQTIPSMYLIGRDGSFKCKNVFEKALLEKNISSAL